LMWFYL